MQKEIFKQRGTIFFRLSQSLYHQPENDDDDDDDDVEDASLLQSGQQKKEKKKHKETVISCQVYAK